MELVQVHQEAVQAAQQATNNFLATHGDRDCCGFAWVTCYEKGTSQFVRELKKLGFQRSYSGGYQLWNPSGSYTQAITAKEKGAEAYVQVFKKHFPEVKMYAGSRMD
jgi:recombinational DNA repair protein RecT